jgi:hypothetical protein
MNHHEPADPFGGTGRPEAWAGETRTTGETTMAQMIAEIVMSAVEIVVLGAGAAALLAAATYAV